MAYDMDEQTYEHLYRWMANNARLGASILDETDLVVTFLQSMTEEEAAYYLSLEWGRAYTDAQDALVAA